jgi:hypothetical protein
MARLLEPGVDPLRLVEGEVPLSANQLIVIR